MQSVTILVFLNISSRISASSAAAQSINCPDVAVTVASFEYVICRFILRFKKHRMVGNTQWSHSVLSGRTKKYKCMQNNVLKSPQKSTKMCSVELEISVSSLRLLRKDMLSIQSTTCERNSSIWFWILHVIFEKGVGSCHWGWKPKFLLEYMWQS